ncbi:hypothetical protein K438DRAFT_1557823 [Mycena galopus ATCC 62051]|nr:hypothetical protein K438DRAFT_1557823 [Mycena galopus ATCC 62051]
MATALFAPLDVGDITIANRIGMSAMTRNRADAGRVPSYAMKKYYLQRALGGAGIIVTEATLISPQESLYDRAPGIWSTDQVAGWRKITNVVHLAGSKIYCQLWHGTILLRHESGFILGQRAPVYGSSPIPAQGFDFLPATGMFKTGTPTEIPDPAVFVQLFKNAAENAKLAGFDGVELLAANGFLVHQFLDSTSNIRTEKWGGSCENRARFGLEVLKSLVEVFGSNVSLKVNPAGGCNDLGMPLDDAVETFSYFLSEADKLKLSYITLSRCIPELDPIIEAKKRGTPHDLVATYGKVIKNAKTFVVGGVTPEEAEELVKTGKVDGVFFGMSWVTHPDLAKRIQHGRTLDNTVVMAQLYDTANVDPCGIGYTEYPAVTY